MPHHDDTIPRFRRIQLSHYYDIVFFLTIFLIKNEPIKFKRFSENKLSACLLFEVKFRGFEP